MKMKDGFLLREVGGRTVVVPVGAQTVDFHGILTLNETGAFLWRALQQPATAETLTAALLDEYEVTAEKAAADVERFLAALREKGLLDE